MFREMFRNMPRCRWVTVISMSFVICQLSLSPAGAQPSWVKKASKSVFTLKTFGADGTLLGSSCGFFVGDNGEAVSCFSPFKGAQRALVIDAAGKEMAVACMLGANETYDVAKFRVSTGKTQPLTVSQTPLTAGTRLWLLPYREQSRATQGALRKAETFNGTYSYYTVALQMPENAIGAPLFTEDGSVVGIMQQPSSLRDTLNYAVSAVFADSLSITGLSINDPVLRSTAIKKALPQDVNQALLTLFVAGSSLDSLSYVQLVDDFIRQFPNTPDGYTARAQLKANANLYGEADSDMEQALKVGGQADEVHYTYSRLIMQKVIYRPEPPYEPWTLDRSFAEAEKAYQANPLPTYVQQQAVVRFAQQRYADAYQIYEGLFNSSLRSPDLFFAASVCKQQLNDTTSQLALLDSCVALFSKPYLKEVAPYLLRRAQLLMDMGRPRAAVNDLNDYETLMKTQLSDQFYYLRFQAEVAGRLFQQALNDISQAISMVPQSDLYYAEKASLQVRVGLYDDAIESANACIRIAPDHSDGYLFLGLAQCLKGQKAEGLANLQKAGDLGDPQAADLIEKYK